MKVLVTGATGFVGSHVVKVLKQKGHVVCLLVRNQQKAKDFFQARNINVDDYTVGSVADKVCVDDALQRCDAVVHAAAITPLQAASEAELHATNVEGVKNVIGGACAHNIKKIVFISSVTAIFTTDTKKLSADAPVARSKHAYGKSKAQAEEYVRQLQAEGKPVITLYPGGIIGPDDPGMSATVMSLVYRLTQGFKVTSGGTQQIDVRDLAELICALLEKGVEKPARYLTVGHYMQWAEFAALLENISGREINKQKIPGWFLRLVGGFYDVKRLFTQVSLPISKETMTYATQWPQIENDPVIADLNISLRSSRETFTDTLQWLLQAGHVRPEDAPALSQ